MSLDLGTLVVYVEMQDDAFDAAYRDLVRALDRLAKNPAEVDVDDTGVTRATDAVQQTQRALDALDGDRAQVRVDANGDPAMNELERVERAVGQVDSDVATVRVEADTDGATDAIGDLPSTVDGDGLGRQIGGSITSGVSEKLGELGGKGGMIVGSVLGAIAIIAEIHPGLKMMEAIFADARSASAGLFSARTGLDAETAKRWATVAGEAYASNFGASVEENMASAEGALLAGLIDTSSSDRDVQDVIERLSTLQQILGEETPRIAQAAGQAIKTGLAGSATEALDLLAKGSQKGLNVSDDLLDTVTEYGTQFRKLGLDGKSSLGLLAQMLAGGARSTDLAADALKEFSIRAVDGSKTTAEGFKLIGLDAKAMAEDVSRGGDDAAGALDRTFQALAGVTDPLTRQQAAVALFGTQAEDLGDALAGIDLSKARQEFSDTAGTVDDAASSIADNNAAKVEEAKRAIETAMADVGAGLAEAFGPQFDELGTWISENRGPITEFVVGLGRGFLDALEAGATFASGVLGIATSVLSALQTMYDGFYAFLSETLGAAETAMGWVPGVGDKISDAKAKIDDNKASGDAAFDSMISGAQTLQQQIEDSLLPVLDEMQAKYDSITDDAVRRAYESDAGARSPGTFTSPSAPPEAQQSFAFTFNGDIRTESPTDVASMARAAADAAADDARAGRWPAGRVAY